MIDWIIGSCVLIVAVFAIRKLFGTRISSRFRYALWAVVMVRLLCPAALWDNQQLTQNITKVSHQLFQSMSQQGNELDTPDSNEELKTENGQNVENTNITGAEDTSNTDRMKNDDTDNVKNQSTNIGQQNGQAINQTENPNIPVGQTTFNQTGKEAAPQLKEYTQLKDRNSNIFYRIIAQLIRIAPTIWLCGSIVAGLWFIGINIRFYRMLMRNRKQVAGSKKPPIYQVKGLSSPCLFGVIHPAIYLKEETSLQDEQLLMILQHERCHYQHKDHIWSVMRSLCIVVWWWNPLVWAAAVASKRDCEMACDEGTLETIGWENKFLYAKTLVDAVSDRKNFGMTVASTMVSGKSDTERRLRMMLSKKKTKMASVVLAAGLMVNAAALCFGGESTAQSQSETQTDQADQTALPVLSAVDVYEQTPTTDGVEEFCETYGLLDKEYVAQITPGWMKDSGIALFRDALNERVYITWQDQLIAVPQLAQGKFTTVSDVKVLSVAAADLDEDGVYEVYFTARVYIGGSSTHTNMIGMAKLTDESFGWDLGADDQMNNKSNVLMLTQNENGELVWSEAQYKKTNGGNLREPTGKELDTFSLTQTDGANEQLITLTEGYLTGHPATGTALEYLQNPVVGQSSDLDNLSWLIPQGRLRWGMTLDELKVWYGDALEIVSEDNVTTVQISDAYIWGCNAAITATVDKKAGVTKLQYEFAKEDKDVVVANANKGLLTNQTVSAAEGINVIYNCVGISPANLELDSQKRFREICEQRGTWSDTEEMRYDAKVTGQLAITENTCELSFEAEPEMAILYRELSTSASSEMSGVRTQWQQLDKENLTFSWTPSLETTTDSNWVMLEGDNANQLSTMAQTLLGVAQPYPFGGFSEKLMSSAAYALDALKQSEDDVICRITDSDGNGDAVFLINENGSGYCFVAVSDDIITQVGLFSFTPCETGKELYNKTFEEINKYDTIVVQ